MFQKNVFAYSNMDREQFTTTHSCIKCNLIDYRFNESSWNEGDYRHSVLNEADLTSCTFAYANFDQSFFDGADLIKSKVILPYGNSSSFRQTSFVNASLIYAQFEYADLSGADFKGANLKRANFQKANLSDVNFEDATVDGINLDYAILIGANITEKQLLKALSMKCAILPDGSINDKNYDC